MVWFGLASAKSSGPNFSLLTRSSDGDESSTLGRTEHRTGRTEPSGMRSSVGCSAVCGSSHVSSGVISSAFSHVVVMCGFGLALGFLHSARSVILVLFLSLLRELIRGYHTSLSFVCFFRQMPCISLVVNLLQKSYGVSHLCSHIPPPKKKKKIAWKQEYKTKMITGTHNCGCSHA